MQEDIVLPEGYNANQFEVIKTEGLKHQPIHDVLINGNLEAPFIYCKNLLSAKSNSSELENINNLHRSYFLVNEENLSITLYFEPHKYHKTIVCGSLKKFSKFEKLGINELTHYTKDELIRTLKRLGGFFPNGDDLAKLVNYFEKFTGSIVIKKTDEKGNNGAYNVGVSKGVEISDLPKFVLLMPLFKGEDAHLFTVEIIMEMTETTTKFWLISKELEHDYDTITRTKLLKYVNLYRDDEDFKNISIIWS